MIHKLKCVWCGKEFEASRKDKLYCSIKCQRAKSWERQKNKDHNHEFKVCSKCKKEFKIKEHAYCRRYCYDCVPTVTTSGAEARKLIKKWAVEYKGGKCERCGYNKCIVALDFHHLDPSQKDFTISNRNVDWDWEVVKQEVDKCILLCANCHRELHYNEGVDEKDV